MIHILKFATDYGKSPEPCSVWVIPAPDGGFDRRGGVVLVVHAESNLDLCDTPGARWELSSRCGDVWREVPDDEVPPHVWSALAKLGLTTKG